MDIMRFFELTDNDGNTAHVPVERFLRIQTFDDDPEAHVEIIFENQEGQDPFIVNINVKKGHQTKVANVIKTEMSGEGDVTVKANNAEIIDVSF
jgi:hypothetical protein